jgi:hypothetical protein
LGFVAIPMWGTKCACTRIKKNKRKKRRRIKRIKKNSSKK